MDFYRFINSRDIRKHQLDMNYKFNAMEAAWLVYQCGDATLDEKNEAWTWIIGNMPDMEVHERINCPYRESLHDTLKKYMALNDELLEKFTSCDEGVYTYIYYEDGERTGIAGPDREVFFSLEECLTEVKDCLEEYRSCMEEEKKDSRYQRIRTCARVIKHFRNYDHKIDVMYDFDCRIKSVDILNFDDVSDEHCDLLLRFFDGFWFDFPTPFQKGDIVHMYNQDPDATNAYDYCKGNIVLTSILPWDLRDEGRPNKKSFAEGESGDTSDMTVYGYFLREDGSIYHECTDNYMDLEYYRGSYKGINRIFKALSSFIKGEIEIELFTYAQRMFVMEKKQEDFKSCNWFTEEGQKLAGLL